MGILNKILHLSGRIERREHVHDRHFGLRGQICPRTIPPCRVAGTLQTVGLWYWVHELKARNIAFSNLVRERVDESSLKVDIALKKARAQLDEKYYAIVERINALVVVEGSENYEPFIRKLNINIAKYDLLVKASKKGRKKGENTQQTQGGSL